MIDAARTTRWQCGSGGIDVHLSSIIYSCMYCMHEHESVPGFISTVECHDEFAPGGIRRHLAEYVTVRYFVQPACALSLRSTTCGIVRGIDSIVIATIRRAGQQSQVKAFELVLITPVHTCLSSASRGAIRTFAGVQRERVNDITQ